ncbi:MAG: pyridoxamine 5'-phosphate oxidase family protein [bacterium]|nr:pyridoxamine 5'-phosphate oxidase family protein [bacterium]
MSKKKYILIALLVLVIGIGVYLKLTFPFLTYTFIKDSLFPAATVVDARTGATLVIYTKELSLEEIVTLIEDGPGQRVLVIGTVNADGTPHAGVLKVSTKDGQIIIVGQPGSQTCKNIERSKKAVIEVYKKPVREAKWFEHVGARLWVKLEKKTATGPLSGTYTMRITAHRAI